MSCWHGKGLMGLMNFGEQPSFPKLICNDSLLKLSNALLKSMKTNYKFRLCLGHSSCVCFVIEKMYEVVKFWRAISFAKDDPQGFSVDKRSTNSLMACRLTNNPYCSLLRLITGVAFFTVITDQSANMGKLFAPTCF